MDNFDMGPLNREGLRWSTLFRRHLPILRMLSIQHGLDLRRQVAPDVRYGVLAVWGQYSADWFPRFGRDEKDYVVVGALRDSRYRAVRRHLDVPRRDAICLISNVKNDRWRGPANTSRRLGFETLVGFVARFVANERIQLAVALAGRTTSGKRQLEFETNFFVERLGTSILLPDVSKRFGGLLSDADEVSVPGSRQDRYSTYVLSDSCKLTIGLASSSLAESFGRGNRLLVVNTTSDSSLDFPIPGLWFLKEPTYEQFARRCLEILSLTDVEYDTLTASAREYLMHYEPDDPPESKILRLASSLLEQPSAWNDRT